MRVCAVQMPHGETLDANLATARAMLDEAAAGGAKLALLPEYFFAVFPGGERASLNASGPSPAGPAAAAPHAERIRALFADASRALGIVVSGNVIEARGEGAFANVGVAYEAGRLVLEQAKVHPMPREAAAGVAGGPSFHAARVGGHDTGMLVCADVLYPEAARVLALQGAEILLNPVMSPYRAEDDGREARVAMYVGRAYDAGAFVVKGAGFKEGMIAGRSLITAPWGVLARAKGDFTQELLYADLDFEKLRAFREKQSLFPARRPEAYSGLL